MSNEYLLQMQAMKNIETFKRYGEKKITVSCMDIGLTLEAFRMAIGERQPGGGVIHHSDQEVQYTSDEYTAMLIDHGFQISIARGWQPI
jgi:hypothetical protein